MWNPDRHVEHLKLDAVEQVLAVPREDPLSERLQGACHAAGMGNPTQSLQVTFIGGVLVWVGALAVKTRSR